ncbi:MAG: hypothetical protein LBP70_01680 [Mycoplasmataceae bacterium]|nr:hypothetical protein [Mycoplasmataceae bacterium]
MGKYKATNAKINKNLINDELDLKSLKKRKPSTDGRGDGGSQPPKPPRKSLEERVASVINNTVPNMIAEAVTKAIKPLSDKLDRVIQLNNLKS